MKLTFLGTGTSQGVPMIGCDCVVCRSPDPRNKRFRTSALVEETGFTVLIDASPDLRSQSLRAGLKKIDAILFTHGHSDHILGIDDLRRFNWIQNQRLPAYGSRATLERIRTLFPYAVENNGAVHPYTRLDLHEVRESFQLGPFEITPFALPHGRMDTTGYFFRRGGKPLLAYFTDCKEVPVQTRSAVRGVPLLILDALRFTAHPTHLTISESLAIAREVGAGRTFFVHFTHDIDHDAHSKDLPERVAFAYDELAIEI